MVITSAEAERISKETTAKELEKLHQMIAKNSNLVRQKHDSDESASDSPLDSPVEDEPKTVKKSKKPSSLSVSQLLVNDNRELQSQVHSLAVKVEQYRASQDYVEKKYEQIRILNSELQIDLHETRDELDQCYQTIDTIKRCSMQGLFILASFCASYIAMS